MSELPQNPQSNIGAVISRSILNRLTAMMGEETKITTGENYIRFQRNPSLNEMEFEVCKKFQRAIIGNENILEFYTEETGHDWKVFLKNGL